MINEDKWESATSRKMRFFDEWTKYYALLYPPMEKLEKSKNVMQLILMNVLDIFWYALFYLQNKFYLDKILRTFLSNKMEFCIFEKKSIIQ